MKRGWNGKEDGKMLHFSAMNRYEAATTRYLSSLIASIRQVRGRLEEQSREEEKWRSRLQLAQSNGRQELADAALQKLKQLQERLSELRREEVELITEAKELRAKLTHPQSGLDPDLNGPALLRALDSFISEEREPGSLERAEEELERLKREEGRPDQGS
jgi:uncharacterized coiled-coil DUF342 family protein